MKKDSVINQLKRIKDEKIQIKLKEFISFLEDFFYFYDLFNETYFNDVFYYLYMEEKSYSYLEILEFIPKNSTMQIYRMVYKMEKFIKKVLCESEYKELNNALNKKY